MVPSGTLQTKRALRLSRTDHRFDIEVPVQAIAFVGVGRSSKGFMSTMGSPKNVRRHRDIKTDSYLLRCSSADLCLGHPKFD